MKIDFSAADHLMRRAVASRVFPGAVLLVACKGTVVLHQAYGMADLFTARPMTRETVFDLASLTKPLATTLATMMLVQQGRLDLDRPACDYWAPIKGQGKERITVRHLLSHRSGLPAWRPYHLFFRNFSPETCQRRFQEAISAESLSAIPGERTEYSDVGFWVLQWIVEQVAQLPMDRFVEDAIYGPLSVRPLFFNRVGRQASFPYAATELCPLRGRLLTGEVHDDNAHALGGVAGHAGLFGNAAAVWALLQELLLAAAGQMAHSLFDRDCIRGFFERQANSSWCLGFDTPAESGSSAGHSFEPGSVGHLGYTGTSFWMDRVRETIVILLSNRVHPCRYNLAIKAFRPHLHDAVMTALLTARYVA
jgi:CubicO group peptidase (beta-lactamase class C family)